MKRQQDAERDRRRYRIPYRDDTMLSILRERERERKKKKKAREVEREVHIYIYTQKVGGGVEPEKGYCQQLFFLPTENGSFMRTAIGPFKMAAIKVQSPSETSVGLFLKSIPGTPRTLFC